MLAVEFRSALRMLNAGWLISAIVPGLWIVMGYGMRELLVSACSLVSTLVSGLLAAELGLFVAIFWSGLGMEWSIGMDNQWSLRTSSHALVMPITVVLSVLSVCMGHWLIKAVNLSGHVSSVLPTGITLLIVAFCSLLVSEYRSLSSSINDTAALSNLFILTGVHFSHVFAGALILWFLNVRGLASTLDCSMPVVQSHHVKIRAPSLETAGILYMHFVELAWIGIHAIMYV